MVKRDAQGRFKELTYSDVDMTISHIDKVVVEIDGNRYNCVKITWENSHFWLEEYILSVLTPEIETEFLSKDLYFKISCDSKTTKCYYGENGILISADVIPKNDSLKFKKNKKAVRRVKHEICVKRHAQGVSKTEQRRHYENTR